MEHLRQGAFAAAAAGVVTLAALALRGHLAATNLAMLYLFAVAAIAMRCTRAVTVAASFLSVAAFDFFCVPPYYTFRIADSEYAVTFAAVLAVALVISTQTARLRSLAADAEGRQARTEALYRLSHGLSGETRVFDAARAAARLAGEVFGTPVILFLPADGKISFDRRTADTLVLPTAEESVAQWVFDRGEKAGARMPSHAKATAVYLPLRGAHETFGVMAVVPDREGRVFLPEQQHLLEVFANQTALAIERTLSRRAAEESRIRMQTEQMRSSLLSAVSHDLRTPLAAITGAASTLGAQGERLDAATRRELLDSISEEAERLGRLVSNLLDMTRFEAGGVQLQLDYFPLEEIVGAALQRIEPLLGGRTLNTDIPEDLPLVPADDVLLGQVLWNLLENAVKYTPDGSPIEVGARAEPGWVVLEVRDRGPGITPGEEERIFEKFYRGGTRVTRGAGLGLPICRAIVEAHRGAIDAYAREGGGAVFRIRLPLGEPA